MNSGNGHLGLMHFSRAPQRVVSLVPSMTESLYQLGAGMSVVGVTEYCPVPADAAAAPAKVGGTRTVNVERVMALEPDLVVANQEENPKEAVEELEEAGAQVWVTFPRSTYDSIRILHTLAQLFRLPQAALQVETLERTLDWTAQSTPADGPRYFCPIWHQAESPFGSWWMTFNGDTYAADLLRVCGGRNVFESRKRLYPLSADLGTDEPEAEGERDTRYPRVSSREVSDGDPEVILLPSEPFAFGEDHVESVMDMFQTTSAVRQGRVHRVDGSLITWHGTRMARALRDLPAYFEDDSAPSGA
jgi:ABC-type Fe3+-hydroxamate transport system substrate-binding protein